MKDCIQYLGKQQKEYLFNLGGPDDQKHEASVIIAVTEALNNKSFLQNINAEQKHENRPDFLLAVGVKLLLRYQSIREATEKHALQVSPEEQENIYYAASAFLHVYELQSRAKYVC